MEPNAVYAVDAVGSLAQTLSTSSAPTSGRKSVDEVRQQRAAAGVDVATTELMTLREAILDGGVAVTGAVLELDLSESSEVTTVTEPPDPEGYVSPTAPEWEAASGRSKVRATAAVSIAGTYSGTESMTLQFMAHRSREVGDAEHQVKLDVFDESGRHLALLEWDYGAAPGTSLETEWGFSIAIGEGKISYGETFSVDLVAADDAAELAAQEAVEETVAEARVSDLDAPLRDVFADVTAGQVLLDGVGLAIDPETDSLQDVLDLLQEAGLGARYDAEVASVVLDSEDAFVLGDEGTGLWAALGIAEGEHAPDTELDTATAKEVAEAVLELDEQLMDLVEARGTNREIQAWRTHRMTTLNTFMEGATGEVSTYKLGRLARADPLEMIDAYLGAASSGGFGGFVGELLELLALPRVETVA